jgi:hypothetical protein
MQPATAIAALTAAEAYLLLHGSNAKPAQAFKLALTELIGRGRLKPQQVPDARIYVLPRSGERLSPTLDIVWSHLARQAGAQWQGIAMKRLGKVVYEHWGQNAERYAKYDLAAALFDKGYYQQDQYRLLGLIPRKRTMLTPLGQQARQELERLQQLARGGQQRWAHEGIAGVAGFAALAGATIFLFDQQGDLLRTLALRPQTPAGAQSGYPYTADEDSTLSDGDTPTNVPDEPQPGIIPGGGGDFGASPEIDWGGFDTLTGVDWESIGNLDTFDSAFDSFSASGDGGSSDSGGGDGGGGE